MNHRQDDASPRRFVALDAFRGIAIAGMILVNTPGSWSYVYSLLTHADWHGCTPTDLVFPFFLFITGAAMAYSFRKYGDRPTGAAMAGIAKRVAILFSLGLFLNWYGYWDNWPDLRVMGVLQRIALAYGLAAIIALSLNRAWRFAMSGALLIGYWLLLSAFGGAEPYGLEHNLVRRIDIAVLGASHLWQGKGVAFDPEGLLSTVPAVVSVLIGYEAVRHLQRSSSSRPLPELIAAGAALVAIAVVWDSVMPINKSLWTSSYVLYTSGISLWLLAGLAWLDRWKWADRPMATLQIYGFNPLLIYALSWLWTRTISVLITVPDAAGNRVSLYDWLFNALQGVFDPFNASLVFALIHVALFWWVSWVLLSRRIVIKI